MEIAILLYDGFTALDAIGPYEVLRWLPDADIKFVASRPGVKTADTGKLKILVDATLSDVVAPEIVLVPGGPGSAFQMSDPGVRSWLRRVHATSRWTTSVCTGSLILAAADLLKGIRSTTYWLAFDELAASGAKATRERVVRDGKIMTAAGVSAGIDMALRLLTLEAGDEAALLAQLAIEYDPQAPYDTAVHRAPPEVVSRLRRRHSEQSQDK